MLLLVQEWNPVKYAQALHLSLPTKYILHMNTTDIVRPAKSIQTKLKQTYWSIS